MSLIWSNYISPKPSFTLWLCFRGRLPTKETWLFDTQNRNCVFCKSVLKSIDHLFFRCTFVKAVWLRIKHRLGITRYMNTLGNTIKQIRKNYKCAFIHNKAIILAFADVVYVVWKTRNEVFHRNLHASVNAVTTAIQFNVCTVLLSIYPLGHFVDSPLGL